MRKKINEVAAITGQELSSTSVQVTAGGEEESKGRGRQKVRGEGQGKVRW